MYDVKYLQNLLEIIEEQKNYTYGFKSLLKTIEIAEVLTIILYNSGVIGENEKLKLLFRINSAKKNAIAKHKAFIKRSVNNMKSFNSAEEFIDLIYEDIFGD